MQAVEVQLLAKSLHELCWALEFSRRDGDYAQASQDYWIICHYGKREYIELTLRPFQSALSITPEDVAGKWLDNEIKKTFRQEGKTVRRGMKLYQEQYIKRREEAIAAATPIHKQQQQKTIVAIKALGEDVEANAVKALHWATEIDRLVFELQQHGHHDSFEDRRLALAQTIRTKTEHYRHAYLPQIEALLRANESIDAPAAIQPAASVGGIGGAADANRSTFGSICHDRANYELSGNTTGGASVATLPGAGPINSMSVLQGQEPEANRVTASLSEQADPGDYVYRAEGCTGVTFDQFWQSIAAQADSAANNAVSVAHYSRDGNTEYFYPKEFVVKSYNYRWSIGQRKTKGRGMSSHRELWGHGAGLGNSGNLAVLASYRVCALGNQGFQKAHLFKFLKAVYNLHYNLPNEPSLAQSGTITPVGGSQRSDDHSIGEADHGLAARQPALHDRTSDDRLRQDLSPTEATIVVPNLITTEEPLMNTPGTPEQFAPRADSYQRSTWISSLTSLPLKDEGFKRHLLEADQWAIAQALQDLEGKTGTKSRIAALSKQLKHLQDTAATVEVEHKGFTGSIQSDPERGLRLQIFGHRGLQQWFRHFIDTESVSEVIAWFKAQVDQDIAAVNADEDRKRVFVGSRNVEDTVLLHQDPALQRQKKLWDALEEGDLVTLNTFPKPEEIRFLETKPVGEIGEWVRVNMGNQPLYHNKLAQVTAVQDEGKSLEVRSEDDTFSGDIFSVDYLWKPARIVRYNELIAATVFQVYQKKPGLRLTYDGSEPFRAMASWIEQILPQQEQLQSDRSEISIAFTDADLEGLYDRPIPEQITALLHQYDFIDNTDVLQDDTIAPDAEHRGWQIAVDDIGLALIKDDRVWDRPLLTEDDPLADADEEIVTAYARQIIDAVEAALEKLSGQQLLFDQATPDDARETLASAIAQPLSLTPHSPLPTPHPRRLIIGDVHGYYDALMQLLKLANVTPEDQLYFLGDLVDRGPKSKEVFEFVRNGNHHCVLGNHEQLLLETLTEHADKSGRARLAHWTQNGGKETIWSYVDSYKVTEFVEQMHESGTVEWLKSLPLSIDLDDLFLVHAGLRPDVPLEQQETRDLLWIRDDFFHHPTPYFSDKLIVGGHTYTIHLDVEAGKLVKGPGWLNIETGAAFSRSGWLTALDWTNQIVYQVNAQTGASRQLPFDEATVTLLPNYQEEGSTFFHNGNTYDLNPLFAATARRRVQSFDVVDLNWILEEEPLPEQERVDRADLTCPILVTRWGDKPLTIDGLHRLTKAKQRGLAQLPARIVTTEEMESSLIQSAPEPLIAQPVEPSGVAKVLASSELLEAARQTYSADRLTGTKPTLKGLIEHEEQLWVAVASGGDAPVLGYSWVDLVRVIPAEAWQEAMQTSDLYSGSPATYQKRQWQLTGDRLRLHLDSDTVEAIPQKAQVQQEGHEIPQAATDSYPELVASASKDDSTSPAIEAVQSLCFLPADQDQNSPSPGLELSIGDRVILRDWFQGDRRGVIASFCQQDNVSIKPDDGEPETFSARSLELETGWCGLKRGDRFRIVRGDDNRESIYTICALYWSINQVGAFTKGTGRELVFSADALELVPEVVEELDAQFEKDFLSRTLKIDDRTYHVKQGDYTKAANLVITSGTTTVIHDGSWTSDEKVWIRQHLEDTVFSLGFTDKTLVVKAPTLIPCLETALKVHRVLVSVPLEAIAALEKPASDPTVKMWRSFDGRWLYTGQMGLRSKVELKPDEVACLPDEDPNNNSEAPISAPSSEKRDSRNEGHLIDYEKSRDTAICGITDFHYTSDIRLYAGSGPLVSCPDCHRLWQERRSKLLRQGCTVNVKHHEYDRYIGRANPRIGLPESKWRNPYKVGKDGTLIEVLEKFKVYLLGNAELMAALPELQGKRKACYCCGKDEILLPDDPLKCHGQILDRALRGDYKDQLSESGGQRSETDSQEVALTQNSKLKTQNFGGQQSAVSDQALKAEKVLAKSEEQPQKSKKHLLIIGCAQSKDNTEGLVPAISRYTGPMYKMLAKLFDRDVVQKANVDIWILSAEFGLIPASEKIPNYDRRMTRERAQELQPQVSARLKEIATAQVYREVYIGLGKDYMLALNLKGGGLREYFSHTQPDGAGYITDLKLGDGGIGERVSKVKRWLECLVQHLPKQTKHLAHADKKRLCGAPEGFYYLLGVCPEAGLKNLPNLCPDCLRIHLPQAVATSATADQADIEPVAQTLNDRLLEALHNGNWQDFIEKGCTDAELKKRIGEIFTRCPNRAAVEGDAGWSAEGGTSPKFWDKFYINLDDSPSLQGGELLRRSRKLLQLSYPKKDQPVKTQQPIEETYKFELAKTKKGSSEILQGSLF